MSAEAERIRDALDMYRLFEGTDRRDESMRVEHTEHFCPNCGKREVYVDRDDPGDYYAGTTHYCMACHFALPDLDAGSGDVLFKHPTHGADPAWIHRYLEIRRGAALPATTDLETVRVERELVEAQRMRDERNAKDPR